MVEILRETLLASGHSVGVGDMDESGTHRSLLGGQILVLNTGFLCSLGHIELIVRGVVFVPGQPVCEEDLPHRGSLLGWTQFAFGRDICEIKVVFIRALHTAHGD